MTGKSKKAKITFTVDTMEDKVTLTAFSKKLGFTSIAAMARVALFQYIRRVLSKRAGTLMHQQIRDIVGMGKDTQKEDE